MLQRRFYTYILASPSGTLYIGMTNNLERRMAEHKAGYTKGFSQKYGCTKLVYYEQFPMVIHAIEREKQLKGWRREKKENIIRSKNPLWFDLSTDWVLPEIEHPSQIIKTTSYMPWEA